MRTYKELDYLGFFDWYCGQYGGLVYSEYKSVYDDLPLDNLIRTELNACIFKWFREKYGLRGFIGFRPNVNQFDYHIYNMSLSGKEYAEQRTMEEFNKDPKVGTYEEAELGCIDKLIEIVKEHGTNILIT